MIKTIHISNVLESYYKIYVDLPQAEREYWTTFDMYDGNRAVMYGDDDKVIITSAPIMPEYLKNLSRLTEWKNVHNFYPAKPSNRISSDCMEDPELRKKLVDCIRQNPGVEIISYRLTGEFQSLIAFLKTQDLVFTTPEHVLPEKQFILDYFNTKRGFRHLWHMAQADNPPYVQIPEGFITENRTEAIEAAWWFKLHQKSFVMKYNRGTQGIGVSIFRSHSLPNRREDFVKHMEEALKDGMWGNTAIIVEEAIKTNVSGKSVSPSIELKIESDGEVRPSYPCDQVLAEDKKTFMGIYIYPELYNDPHIQKAFESAVKYGKLLSKYGYRGIFDIDLIRSNDDDIYAVESNMRRTGGTHLHELCISALGSDYWKTYHVRIEDVKLVAGHGLSYSDCYAKCKDILFDRNKKRGIIFSNPDMLKVNIVAYIAIGTSAREIEEIRREFRKIFDGALLGEKKYVGGR